MKYIYGPVPSWRLGRSLGIDLISGEKRCSFDCSYCQLGNGNVQTFERKVFIKTGEIIKEFESLPKDLEYDYITFSGSGEPTLASNIGEVAAEIKKRSKKPIALLTNSTMLHDPLVRKELKNIDLVLAKLDASCEEILGKVNCGKGFDQIISGIKAFKKEYPQKLALQIIFTQKNIDDAEKIAKLAKEIEPKIVYIGTPTRECGEGPLPEEKINELERFFNPLLTKSVYSARKVDANPIDIKETKKRRPSDV